VIYSEFDKYCYSCIKLFDKSKIVSTPRSTKLEKLNNSLNNLNKQYDQVMPVYDESRNYFQINKPFDSNLYNEDKFTPMTSNSKLYKTTKFYKNSQE
jgi:hypothetical protein